jgi:tripartite-type tricarboxylate transporter receptor subunit TctC
MNMRGTVIVLGLLGLVWQIGAALAQTYPTKPVRVIVAQSAGANMDTTARIVTPKMSDALARRQGNLRGPQRVWLRADRSVN